MTKEKQHKTGVGPLFAGMALAAVIGGATAFGVMKYTNYGQKTYQTVEYRPDFKATEYQGTTESQHITGMVDFKQAAAVSRPAVVHITTYQEVSNRSRQQQHYRDPFFDDFFRDFFEHQQRQQQQQPQNQGPVPSGSGSGVILSEDGYIVTNNHVIKNADQIEIVLNDKRKYEATLVGVDPTTDLAVLKIEAEDLPTIKMGNSDAVQVGEWVLAVGNPFNLTSTVTAGIVSAKARNINILHDKENLAIESFIQTDAAVNPGNSGGALVDSDGNLVGINTAIATPTGTYAGYAFAVPVNLVKKVVEDLKEYGVVQRALLGVSIAEVNAELAEEKGLDKIEGVYIAGVREESAAAEAGLQEGDIILKINGTTIKHSSQLQEVIARYRPGETVTVTYKRGDKTKDAKVTLKNKLGTTQVVKKGETQIVQVLGASLKELSDQEKSDLGLSHGVKVDALDNGKLSHAGIRKGFVITVINRQKVEKASEVAAMLQGHSGGVYIEGVYPSGERAYYAFGL